MSKYQGMIYQPKWVNKTEKLQILEYIRTLHPIWEMRFSKSNPPPEGETNRQLLRPVYWLGNWQFACLDYYHPPKGIYNRCVRAEGFTPVLQGLIQKIESLVKSHYPEKDVPSQWAMNTCLINFYGSKFENEKWEDVARVGEHKDFEPGPVASISFGESALIQFVESAHKGAQSKVVLSQWLEDSSLQIFGGDRLKKKLFHRVQRVENKGSEFDFNTPRFKTRRLNFTFRYVPRDHFVDYRRLPAPLQEDVLPYMTELAEHSPHFREALAAQPMSAK